MATRKRRQRTNEPTSEQVQPSHAGLRPFWSGTISFGLVSVPVDVYPATRSSGVTTRMLAPDDTPVRRRYYDSESGKDVEYADLVRGYEVEKERYVVVTDEELESVEPRKSRDIDLRLFTDRDQLDPIYFGRAYVMVPSSESTKPYRLLADVMEREDKVGIATAVMRDKEYLLAIAASGGVLTAQVLRFADDLRSPSDVGLPKHRAPAADQVKAFERAMADLAKPNVVESELVDRRVEQFRALVERKRKRGQDVVEVAREELEPLDAGDEPSGDDLVETIRRSLGSKRKRPGASGRASHARRASQATRKTPQHKRARTARG